MSEPVVPERILYPADDVGYVDYEAEVVVGERSWVTTSCGPAFGGGAVMTCS